MPATSSRGSANNQDKIAAIVWYASYIRRAKDEPRGFGRDLPALSPTCSTTKTS